MLIVAALATALPASLASHCGGFATSAPLVKAGSYYVVADVCQPQCLFSAWVYQESNGLSGLQRGDHIKDDTCHGLISSDTILF